VLLRGRLSADDTIRIGADVASALSAAHQGGITHRDVKPANIILTRDGGVKLVDFGLAKMMHGEPSPLTRTGAVLGTISYMAPEQLGGEPSDHRVDLWALGVVLYESVAGVLPFRGAGAARRILIGDAAPLSSVAKDVPAALDDLVNKLLQKDPAARLQTAWEVERRLRLLIAEGWG
jgi:serine/threonine-protein kinase